MTSGEIARNDETSLPDFAVTRRQILAGAAMALVPPLLEACSPGESDRPGEPVAPHVSIPEQEVAGETNLLQGGVWENMAGARVEPDSLTLNPTGLAIVNKRENGRIDPDPPLNVYGSRLAVRGNFSASARIQSDTGVSFQLYSKVPLRFDDFRYERGRVECHTQGNTLTVRVWDGSSQTPAVQTFPFTGSATDRQIELRREESQLVFMVNGQRVGNVAKGALFNTGEAWIGLNSEQGPARVSQLTARPLDGGRVAVVNTAGLRITNPLPEGLQTLVRRPGFHIGAAAALNPMVSDPQYAQIFLGGELGSITTENCLKPQDTQPNEGVFTFDEAEALIQLAEQHGMVVHGHTLLYDKAMPRWMTELPYRTDADKLRLREVLRTHIQTVVGHFRGRVASWDVANELLSGFNDGVKLANNNFLNAFGSAIIADAFRWAHAADPNAKLYINDYGLETNPQGRGRFMFAFVKNLLSQGAPIHGIGVQGHEYKLPRDTIKSDTLKQLMKAADDLKLFVRVSELDVTGAKGAKAQADQYANVLRVGLEAPNCTGLTIWGLHDLYGSTASLDSKGQLKAGDALIYTTDCRPKLARRAMQRVLSS